MFVNQFPNVSLKQEEARTLIDVSFKVKLNNGHLNNAMLSDTISGFV